MIEGTGSREKSWPLYFELTFMAGKDTKVKIMKEQIHGGDVYRHKNVLDFSSNMNPLGTPPGVIKAAAESMKWGGRTDLYSGSCPEAKPCAADGPHICRI